MKKKEEITNGWNDPEVQEVLKQQIREAGQRSIQEHKEYEDKLIEKGHIQGVAYAVAEMYRHGDEVSIWKAWGMPTLEECKDKYEVAEYDLNTLMEHKEELEKEY